MKYRGRREIWRSVQPLNIAHYANIDRPRADLENLRDNRVLSAYQALNLTMLVSWNLKP